MNTFKNDTNMDAPATTRDCEEATPEWIPGVVKELLDDEGAGYTATLKRHGANWIKLTTEEEFAKYGLVMPPESTTHTCVVIVVYNLAGWTPPHSKSFPDKVYEDKMGHSHPLNLKIRAKSKEEKDETIYIFSGGNHYFHNSGTFAEFGVMLETVVPKVRAKGVKHLMLDICNRRFSTHDLLTRCYATRAARIAVPAIGEWFRAHFKKPSFPPSANPVPPRLAWLHEHNVLGKLANELRSCVAWHGHEAGIEAAVGSFTGRVIAEKGFDDLWLDTQWAVAKEAGMPKVRSDFLLTNSHRPSHKKQLS
ncbi:hypothetical protein CYMTET_19424 [Cymbomonas tetramitiformis]|uniref:Uncharacterized protein n=1 Tax=Cymbomonas tetramitiformis TaxID=36881 RepID=A0AAE0G7E3_9CHLO|nr:hypothetical protein CYMTET_19424 [Cymbomonas tetramitiformis]